MDKTCRSLGQPTLRPCRLSFAECNRRSTDLEQTELELMTVFVDRLHLNRNVIAEAHLAAGRLAAQPVLALAENPEVAADRRHRHHPLHEDFVELDEESERGHARHGTGEFFADFVA